MSLPNGTVTEQQQRICKRILEVLETEFKETDLYFTQSKIGGTWLAFQILDGCSSISPNMQALSDTRCL